MTTLHMEVDVARTTQKNVMDTHSQVMSLVQSMASSVETLRNGGWMGNSATEFFGEFDQWRSTTNSLLENLNALGGRLANEITEWETTAAKLA